MSSEASFDWSFNDEDLPTSPPFSIRDREYETIIWEYVNLIHEEHDFYEKGGGVSVSQLPRLNHAQWRVNEYLKAGLITHERVNDMFDRVAVGKPIR